MIGSFIGAASHIIKIVSIVMHKTIDGTKLFVRFLREKGIKYAYAEETLRYERIKKHEWKMYSNLLNDEVGGNLLKYLETMNPNVKKNVFKSVENVNLATIIAYSDDERKHHFLDTYDKGE